MNEKEKRIMKDVEEELEALKRNNDFERRTKEEFGKSHCNLKIPSVFIFASVVGLPVLAILFFSNEALVIDKIVPFIFGYTIGIFVLVLTIINIYME